MAFSPETYALLLKKIEEGGGGGGSSLPSVTEADNGKVLSVVNGAWAARKEWDLVINAEYDEETTEISNPTLVSGTYSDLLSTYNSGRIINGVLTTEYNGINWYFYLSGFGDFSEEENYLVFVFTGERPGSPEMAISAAFIIDSENNIYVD